MNKLKVKNPEEIEFTLTVTMSLSEWEMLTKQIWANKAGCVPWPACQFTSEIASMTSQATQKFYPESEAK